jgi:glutamate-ammonia-ligase adenylyltransferase
VDVFTVQPGQPQVPPGLWARYADELAGLLRLMHAGQRREARGQLASRVALALQENVESMTPLYPIEIEIDNQASEKYTILYIDSIDTIGFLYELTNALAYGRVYIARVVIDSIGSRVRDVLYVTDDRGQKITAPNRLRELRAAIVLTKHFTHLLYIRPTRSPPCCISGSLQLNCLSAPAGPTSWHRWRDRKC